MAAPARLKDRTFALLMVGSATVDKSVSAVEFLQECRDILSESFCTIPEVLGCPEPSFAAMSVSKHFPPLTAASRLHHWRIHSTRCFLGSIRDPTGAIHTNQFTPSAAAPCNCLFRNQRRNRSKNESSQQTPFRDLRGIGRCRCSKRRGCGSPPGRSRCSATRAAAGRPAPYCTAANSNKPGSTGRRRDGGAPVGC